MTKSAVRLIFVTFLFWLIACASTETNVVVKEDGNFSVVASSYTTNQARKAALMAAQDYCRKLGKRLVTKNDDGTTHIYSEADEEVRSPATSFEKERHPGTDKPNESTKVTIEFRCI